jgi:hypothetical protein
LWLSHLYMLKFFLSAPLWSLTAVVRIPLPRYATRLKSTIPFPNTILPVTVEPLLFSEKSRASSKLNNADCLFWFKLRCVLANPHQTHILFTLKPIVIMKKFSSAPTGRFQSFAQFFAPHFITFLLILLQSFFSKCSGASTL